MAKPTDITIPAAQRAKIMARAWEIFRQRYAYPRVPFRSIGRHCFASALKAAWHEARELVRLAACGVDNLKRWIDDLSVPAHAVGLQTSWTLSSEALRRRADDRNFYRAALALAQAA